MIDWLTLKISALDLNHKAFHALRCQADTIMRIDVESGEVVWQIMPWETLRSDNHAINVRYGTDVYIAGTPARLFSKYNDNVFGPDDVGLCAERMLQFVAETKGIILPHFSHWQCTRLDITFNYLLPNTVSKSSVSSHLRHCSGGRYQVRNDSDTIKWSPRSQTFSGKAYFKGQHLLYQLKKNVHNVPMDYVRMCENLLRLELKLGNKFFSRKYIDPYYTITESILKKYHNQYFTNILGKMNINKKSTIQKQLQQSSIALGFSKGLGTSAYHTYLAIKESGIDAVKDEMSPAAYYRHKQIMFNAGMSWANLQPSNVIPMQMQPVVLGDPVHSWSDLERRYAHRA